MGLALLTLILVILVLCAVPPVSRDALTHHLAIPKLWIDNGGIYETPDVVFSYYPMNLDLLFTLPLIFGNDILPKYLHFIFGLATGFLLYRFIKHRLNRTYALTGVLLFLSLPVIVKLSITAYVDLGLVFFSTAAIYLLVSWQSNGCRTSSLLIGSAVCCGLALGTKYNALVVFLLMTLMVPCVAVAARQNTNDAHGVNIGVRAIWDGMIFAGVALIIFSPWAIRNIFWTGNPLYPLYDGLFNPLAPYKEPSLHPFLVRKLVYGESFWETILIPLRIFFQGQDDVPALFDGRLNPGLFILPLLGLWPPSKPSRSLGLEKRLLSAFAVLFILIVFFTRDMRIRYIAPAIPFLVILSIYGLNNYFEWSTRLKKTMMRRCLKTGGILFVLTCFGWNAVYIAGLFAEVRPLDYLSGRLTREAYIETFRPEYAAIQYINHSVMDGDRVGCVFLGNRGYYFNDAPLFYEWGVFKDMVAAADGAEMLALNIRQQGLTHMVIGVHQLQEWSQRSLSVENQHKLQDFLANQLEMLFNKNGYVVYRLKMKGHGKS